MNIIQIQDRLKGLPTEALVNYVEQPMGEVPIYLALGELQRRKEMRERFVADQMPPPSVAEQLVAENKPQPMGIAGMAPQRMMPAAQGVGAPQPAPEIDPRQMAASGIAANPVSNVGGPAMMAGGGIVGKITNKFGKSNPVFEDGSIGANPGLLIPAALSRIGAGLASQKVGLPALIGAGTTMVPFTGTSMVPYTGTDMVPYNPLDAGPQQRAAGMRASGAMTTGKTLGDLTPTEKKGLGKKVLDYISKNKGKSILVGGGLAAIPFFFGDDGEVIDLPETAAPAPFKVDFLENLGREAYSKQYLDELGVDESRQALTEKVASLTEQLEKDKGNKVGDLLTQIGLNIAAGQSPDALTNISAGAIKGQAAARERQKELEGRELTLLKLQGALGQAERAEKAAALQFGTQSQQFIDAQNTKLKVAEMTMMYNEARARQAAIENIQKNDLAYAELESKLRKQYQDEDITFAEYQKQLDNYINSKIGAAPASGATAPEGMTQAGVTPDGKIVYQDADGKQYVGG